MEPLNWAALQAAKKASALDLYRSRAGFDKAGQLIDAFLSRYDLILTPTTVVPAQKLGALRLDQPYESYAAEAMNSSAFTSLFNISGHPAMSVPLHWTADTSLWAPTLSHRLVAKAACCVWRRSWSKPCHGHIACRTCPHSRLECPATRRRRAWNQ
jgi:Asp-tRNA(Asn)/Glu-tRNA(Gln) amidotransferase A subunit family amidase